MLSFQQIIQRLLHFWEKQGCILQQGYDLEMGAGTFNPSTFLRCLGPEPFKTAYVEPSRRPSDGRYGENPNRFQLFHQFQVIIKPSPQHILKTYLQSLEAIGLNLKEHDIRFVHDDWEGPTLGAWGLGWEVWLDGMEVTQFTYFQAMGSLSLHPVSVEITYGLERLAMFLQKVNHFLDIRWNDELTFGQLVKQNEVQWSRYNFEESHSAMWFRHFDDYEKEATTLINKNLPIPAYDFVMKASHAFNMLDARGVISVTERTGYIHRIRELAKQVALSYLEFRKELEFPLLQNSIPPQTQAVEHKKSSFNAKKTDTFLLEVGSEPLPATFVPIGIHNLKKKIEELLNTHKIAYESISSYATPRRLSLVIEGLAHGSAKEIIEKKGPALSVAFDASGTLTPQGRGFMKSVGIADISLDDLLKKKKKELEVKMVQGQQYLFAHLVKEGRSTVDILREELPNLILHLDFPKKMRWSDLPIAFPRPIQWIVALLGKTIIPFDIGFASSGRITYGHAQLSDQKIKLASAEGYVDILRNHKVIVDIDERKNAILTQLETKANNVGGIAIMKEKVMPEVLYLSEYPQLALGSFDANFLTAPKEVLIFEMVKHQRYFPIEDQNGKLLNSFVITCDNTPNHQIICNNERVLSARLSDGVFLYKQDLKTPLAYLNEKLKMMTFQKQLGSVYDKVERLVKHAKLLNEELKIAEVSHALCAAELCKADLASALVSEFPELQGTAGKYYARAQGEDKEVALAIEEHWMPISENAPIPQTPTGMILSLADKFDNLIGYYGVDLKPTSSSDPYALRRQTLGILKIFIAMQKSVDLRQLLLGCSKHFTAITIDVNEILQFITNRAKTLFEDYGFKKDEVEASLAHFCIDPYSQLCKVNALHAFRRTERFQKLYEVYKRAKGQIENTTLLHFDPLLLQEPAEQKLYHKTKEMERVWKELMEAKDYQSAYNQVAELQPYLSNLFDTVLILCEDLKVRNNRIALLQKIFSYFYDLLDFSKIQNT